jgi:hypothetical protein
MHWLIENVSRYATPEVATVVGALVGGLAAWKAVGWGVRAVLRLVATAIRHVGGATLTLSGMTVMGATSIGWGVAGLADMPTLPTMAVAAGIATVLVSWINAIARTV